MAKTTTTKAKKATPPPVYLRQTIGAPGASWQAAEAS